MVGKYKVITLCGSTKFKDEFLREQKRLTLEGNIVITVGLFGHSGDDEVWTENKKEMLDDMHKRKIDMADEIFVINKGDYIGTSTRSEIEYAKSTSKIVNYMESHTNKLIKPEHLQKGDKVAIVSLSRGMLGEPWAIHKLEIARKRLTEDFGLKVVVMPNALKGMDYLMEHPEARAKDLMDAFKDTSIKAIFNSIGGDDTIRLLPYIDFNIIKNNPKIFTGFSDTTVNHFMMHKAGIVSYYGASIMNNFSEYIKINDYTLNAIKDTLFEPKENLEIKSSPICSYAKDVVRWNEENMNVARKFYKEENGYEILQGKGKTTGELLGGCADTILELLGTPLWPSIDDWKGKIIFLETSDSDMSEETLRWLLRNFQAQGIFDVIKGIIVGKPACEDKYESYKSEYIKVVGVEANHPELPIIYNVNVGHAEPICVLPEGINCELDCDNKKITLLEPATK